MIDELAKAACMDKAVYGRKECERACVSCTVQTGNLLRRLREPTPEMIAAGYKEWHQNQDLADTFMEMIDVAIRREG